MITAPQIRAGRALLDWSQTDLATKTGLAPRTVRDAENGSEGQRISTVNLIERILAEAGVEFVGHTGVKMKDGAL
jgi:transcriptional regulator with XRE-family HTH domain